MSLTALTSVTFRRIWRIVEVRPPFKPYADRSRAWVALLLDFSPRSAPAPWKIQPEDIAQIVVSLAQLPARTMVSYVEVRPSEPKRAS